MTEHDHALALLRRALKDYKALKAMKNVKTFADEIFGFHAQQTAEKSLKAWLSAIRVGYPKTHDLTVLLSLLEKKGESVKMYWDLVEYNAFAVQYRYEDFQHASDDPIDRKDVLRSLAQLLKKVQQHL